MGWNSWNAFSVDEAKIRDVADALVETYRVEDVWSDATWTTGEAVHATVEPHGVAFYRIWSA